MRRLESGSLVAGFIALNERLRHFAAKFDYEIKFEQHDENRWCVTKLDGKSGLPEGR